MFWDFGDTSRRSRHRPAGRAPAAILDRYWELAAYRIWVWAHTPSMAPVSTDWIRGAAPRLGAANGLAVFRQRPAGQWLVAPARHPCHRARAAAPPSIVWARRDAWGDG